MEYQKNCKKPKNGLRQDEQLLINYSGGEQRSDSDSDRVKPLELPPTRLRRPKSRKIRVSSSNTKSVFSIWNFCQVIFVVVVIGTMICMVWFSIILKTSLDNMKKRVSILETSDRSTSKQCDERGEELQKKVEALRGTTASLVTSDEKKIKSLLKKISILNKTVDLLHKRLKSPKSVSSINNDISLLKKAMADTGREMTEVTDKVSQLRRIAHLQNNNIKHLKVQMYNVTVQLAKLAGKPTPRPVINTGTPPWLLRIPADSISHPKPSLLQMETFRKNITLHVKKDMGKIVAYVKRANKSVQTRVQTLQEKLSALVKDFDKHKALMYKLIKKAQQGIAKGNETAVHDNSDSLEQELSNLTLHFDDLSSQFASQNKKYASLAIDVSSINLTLHRYVNQNARTVPSSCNCSLENLRETLSKDKDLIKSLQFEINEVHKSIEKLHQKDTSSTLSTPMKTTQLPESSTKRDTMSELPTTETKQVTTNTKKNLNITETPTISMQQPTTSDQTNTGKVVQTSQTPTSQMVTPSLSKKKTDKRMTDDDDDDDLNSWPGETTDDDI